MNSIDQYLLLVNLSFDVMFVELEASSICYIVACIRCMAYLTTHFEAILSTHRLSTASFPVFFEHQ